MMVWWAMLLDAVPADAHRDAAIELRSIAPAADLVPCILRTLGKAGTMTARPIERGTAIDLHDKSSAGNPESMAGFSIRITEAGPQRILRATYRQPVTAKLARRLMGQAGRACFPEEWRTHEWERR